MARTFFRLVKSATPRQRDFFSNETKRGAPVPDLAPHLQRLWDGISVHETEAQARRQARETPWLGRYIAELHVPEPPPGGMRWERTIAGNDGHFTLWGDPKALLSYVVQVIPVQEAHDE